MSKRNYINADELHEYKTIPSKERPMKTGNGKAAQKTLTACVKAAEAARDEAKVAQETSSASAKLAVRSVVDCQDTYEAMQKSIRRACWVILAMLVVNMLGTIACCIF